MVEAIDSDRFQRAENVGAEGGCSFLVSDFFSGVNLLQLAQARGRLSVKESVYCVARVIEGLQVAHENQIVHGELRPSKILINKRGAIAVRDLTIAQVTRLRRAPRSASRTITSGMNKAQIEYAAPEILSGMAKPSLSTDLYSLGCILFFLLTGRPPYSNRNLGRTIRGHLHGKIPKASMYSKGIPAALDHCLEQMLAKQPSARFATYKQCHTALREIVDALPGDDASSEETWQQMIEDTLASSDSAAKQPLLWSGRWLIMGVVMVAVTVVSILSLSIWRTSSGAPAPENSRSIREIPVEESEDIFNLR